MIQWLSTLVDRASDFFAHRKGLLPLLGVLFVLINLVLQAAPRGWLVESNLFLHLGVIVAILGLLLARVL